MIEERKQDSPATLLVVDDDSVIRVSLSQILAEIGFSVLSAEDGFSALAEIRKQVPDVILSDLNMPGMSGFEFLSVVRQRFPAIPVIAMSGAFSGDEVPSGVAADAFFQKGSGIRSLLMIIAGLAKPDRLLAGRPATTTPLCIHRDAHDAPGDACVSITCPGCLRMFRQSFGGALNLMRETRCVHCQNSIRYTVVEPADWASAQSSQIRSRAAKPSGQPELHN